MNKTRVESCTKKLCSKLKETTVDVKLLNPENMGTSRENGDEKKAFRMKFLTIEELRDYYVSNVT